MKWSIAFTSLFLASAALAHDISLDVPQNAKWEEECSSCHIAYPPQLLTADNWKRMMSSLDKHFGENAELDAADNKIISTFLKRYAGNGARHKAKTLRISDTPWFKDEHDEISSSAWTDPAVKSPANCSACHVDAEQGDWSEDGIQMPDGISSEEDEDEEEGDD